MRSALEFSGKLGRTIRSGDPETLGIPTEQLAVEAFAAGDVSAARDWLEYAIVEPRRIIAVYTPWLRAMLEYGGRHVPGFDAELQRLETAIGVPAPLVDADEVGEAEAGRVRRALEGRDVVELRAAIAELRRAQWAVHDDQGDWLWGIYTVFLRSLGEDGMEDAFRETLGSWVSERYAALAALTQHEKLVLTIDLMRGHFCGPSDDPYVHVREHDDRWELSFDPCGSGGRMRRGDPVRAQIPRTEPPFEFAFAERAHDWTWGREGVCVYCAHCAFVNEILPIEMTGAPLRVTDYPQEPGDRCRWTVYKAVEDIPARAYARVGKRKP